VTPVYPALRDLLPHRPPMILIDELVHCTAAEVVCRVTVRDGDPFVVDGRVPALVSLEYFAQTVAALYGYQNRHRAGGFTVGMLLGTRELTLAADYFDVGDTLTISGAEAYSAPPISQFRCELRRGDDVLARGAISVLSGGPPPSSSTSPSSEGAPA
jgi:predicted hotdog family 3-hydroxylacyl-ACP dehydratase